MILNMGQIGFIHGKVANNLDPLIMQLGGLV